MATTVLNNKDVDMHVHTDGDVGAGVLKNLIGPAYSRYAANVRHNEIHAVSSRFGFVGTLFGRKPAAVEPQSNAPTIGNKKPS